MKHRSYLKANSFLFFVLNSISLSYSWFEFGLAYPHVEGIGLIWLFPCVYFLFLLLSLRLAFVKVKAKKYLTFGIIPLAFITSMWLILILMIIDSKKTGHHFSPDYGYPLVLFVVSLVIFILYFIAYKCAIKEMMNKAFKEVLST